MAGRSRSPRPDITSVIIRLELLGYEYRGVDYNNGEYIYVTFEPGFERAGMKINMLGGKDFGEIMERIGEMPILTTDPTARMVEERNRRKATSYQVRHREWGVYQGSMLGMGFWHPLSDMPEQGFCEFPTREEAESYIRFLATESDAPEPAEHFTVEPYDRAECERLRAEYASRYS